jgi:hypothetical protein
MDAALLGSRTLSDLDALVLGSVITELDDP